MPTTIFSTGIGGDFGVSSRGDDGGGGADFGGGCDSGFIGGDCEFSGGDFGGGFSGGDCGGGFSSCWKGRCETNWPFLVPSKVVLW